MTAPPTTASHHLTLAPPPELTATRISQATAGEYAANTVAKAAAIAEPETFVPEMGRIVPTQTVSRPIATPSSPKLPADRRSTGATQITQVPDVTAPDQPMTEPEPPIENPPVRVEPKPQIIPTETLPATPEIFAPTTPPATPKTPDGKEATPSNSTLTAPEREQPAATSAQSQGIPVVGSTVFSEADLAAITSTAEITPASAKAAADKLTQRYMQNGYVNSRAIVESTANGYQIRAIEGSVEAIQVEGNQRLSDKFIRDRVQRSLQTPLNSGVLEQELRLLRLNPLFEKVEASLRPGQTIGQSLLVVRVKEAPPLTGGVSFDNYSPPSVGSERISAHLGSRNLTGNGDELGGFYSRSLNGGAESYGLSYTIPLSAQENQLQLRFERNRNVVKQDPFEALGIRGNNEIYELTYSHPVIRNLREEFKLSLGLTVQNGQTFTFNTLPTPFGIGPDSDGVSRTSVIKFAQDYLSRDQRGTWNLRSQFNFGTGLFNATRNSGDIPDGQFFSWNGQAQRVQRLSQNHLLIAQAEVQLSADSLLPSQQFLIGGAQSVRGYRQNLSAGDIGLRFSLEDRITIAQDPDGNPKFQLAPFLEAGYVRNRSDNPNRILTQNKLLSLGLGLIFTPNQNFQARLDYGIPLLARQDQGKNIQDNGFHFRLNYRF